jgi:hypothetical protein
VRDNRKQYLLSGYFEASYAYFAGSGLWQTGRASHPEDLTDKTLESNRVLMNDSLFHWWVEKSWSYNHGKRGATDHYPNTSGKKDTAQPPDLAGFNELYGDGRVVWITRTKIPSLLPSDVNARWVQGYNADTTFY